MSCCHMLSRLASHECKGPLSHSDATQTPRETKSWIKWPVSVKVNAFFLQCSSLACVTRLMQPLSLCQRIQVLHNLPGAVNNPPPLHVFHLLNNRRHNDLASSSLKGSKAKINAVEERCWGQASKNKSMASQYKNKYT